jgi:integrase
LDAQELTPAAIECFLRDRAAAGYVHHLTPRALRPLCGYLKELSVLPQPVETTRTVPGPVEELLTEFSAHLARERGLAARTIERYTDLVARFLSHRAAERPTGGLELAGLSPREVDAFLLTESTRVCARSPRAMVTALRALFRFLTVKGLTAPGFAEALPGGPGWRQRSQGRVLDDDEIARLLSGCDRRRPAGRRDYAALALMVRLGLRANEVAALRFGDIDWRAGEFVVRAKGARVERLPLTVDVGQALADYCRHGRPAGSEGTVFLHVRAPYAPLSRTGVGEMVRRACRRAGLRPVGAHRLRHTAATAMRRGGAPLGEIAQVLRHRHHTTTAIYVNVEAEELRPLARDWPGAVA